MGGPVQCLSIEGKDGTIPLIRVRTRKVYDSESMFTSKDSSLDPEFQFDEH